MPLSIMPPWIQTIAKVLPLAPLNSLLRDFVYDIPLYDLWRLGVFAGWLVLAAIVTVKFFRWE
jgi:ABC-type multidrug transport system permease subunit